MPAHHAAFIEPLACSIHAVQRGNIEFQDTVVIAGAGPLGLGMIAAARMKQPAQLIAVDLNDARLEMARRCGADIGLNPTRVDVVDEVRKLTDGYGCDVYIEATGHPQAVVDGLHDDPQARHLRRVLGDARAGHRRLDHHRRHQGARTSTAPTSRPHTYPVAIRMLEQGLLPIDEIVTQRMPLADFQKGIDLVASGATSIKVTLEP